MLKQNMVKKQRYYVVWVGKNPGIYTEWPLAQAQISAVPNARYKAFDSLPEAEYAYSQKPEKILFSKNKPSNKPTLGHPITPSISVDAACAGNPGVLEYQGVDTATKQILFKRGPYPEGTVNLGEFLALVHGLALLKKNKSSLPVYSDSITAMAWVRNKKIKTTLLRNDTNTELMDTIDRALDWLKNNSYPNKILKWETTQWGENPADYGRK
jgi:ribonuclease HI